MATVLEPPVVWPACTDLAANRLSVPYVLALMNAAPGSVVALA
ncbi:MAG: hypothetical protein AB1801_15725 [Chloroflexota bacterium]